MPRWPACRGGDPRFLSAWCARISSTRRHAPGTMFPPMPYSALIHAALDYAAVAHRAQVRKSPEAEIPYMAHCAGVALILARHGLPEEVIAAGALHDTLEDTDAPPAALDQAFGPRVRALVQACSEPD